MSMSDTNKLDQLLHPSTSLGVKKGKPFFMAHMIAGYPTIAESEKVAEAFVKEGGVDIIELQIPFSDPMADGPTIAVASEEALKKGATVAKSLALLEKVTRLGKPVAVMTYINIPFRFGIQTFVATITKAGASALIVPDCPFDTDEGRALLAACKKENICLIPVVSPGVPRERLEFIAKDARGFFYCTTRQGITGATSVFASDLPDFIKMLREISNLPVGVGFGVKSREDVQTLAQIADIVIAGSVFVSKVKAEGLTTLEETMRALI